MMFFVLSGFLITRILLTEHAKSGTISLHNFYRGRAFRILPTFYVFWLIETLLLALHQQHVRWWEHWTSFFFLTDYARAFAGEASIRRSDIAWSLGIEEQFYLLWPAMLLWMLASRKNATRILTGFIVFIWVYRAILFVGFGVSYDYIYNAFDTRIDSLMMGSLLAILTLEAAENATISKKFDYVTATPWFGVAPLSALLAILVFDHWIKAKPLLSMMTFSLQPILIAVLLIQAVCFGNTQWRFLAHPALRFIAKISYAVYLYHALVIGEARRITITGHSGRFLGIRYLDPANHPRQVLLVIPAIAIPIISYYGIERSFMRLRDRKKKSPVVLAAV
jgi:peptidoglycan/LPS O-acetylase OafA/YrhL